MMVKRKIYIYLAAYVQSSFHTIEVEAEIKHAEPPSVEDNKCCSSQLAINISSFSSNAIHQK